MRSPGMRRQRGVTLIVGLILLVLITLMVTTAFTLSSTNLKAVGNMQMRNEAVAAASKAVEQVISTSFPVGFMSVPVAQTITFDINNDGVVDYSVGVAVPECVQSTEVAGSGGGGVCSSATLEGFTCATANYLTTWNISSTVTDAATGTSIQMIQGVKMELTTLQRDAVCPA